MNAITHWRHHLQGAQHKFVVCTDHKVFCYFCKPQKLLSHQARVMQTFLGYKFKYKFVKGELNILLDLLSHNPAMYPVRGNKDPKFTIIMELLVLPDSGSLLFQTSITAPVGSPQLLVIDPAPSSEASLPLALSCTLLHNVLVAQHSAPDGQAIFAKLSSDSAFNGPYTLKDRIIYQNNKVWVPKELQVCHDRTS
ncbi:hypothetical protein DSO57_1008333 [Entomophthora muscae]|uniref:Uncharacterized protein n=1 Tax=Entomophthora muscae TaxID=34485 RepID=A0ACC2S8W5_9FUNG|nr:hypothetical protein DSO57_1008333 [Entomophthora muscae]